MKNFYRFCFLLLFFAGAQFSVIAQCPTDRVVSPAAATICAGSTVNITIASSQNNIGYQLQNNATNAALSGFFIGTGGNLIITSNSLPASVVVKVMAINPFNLCAIDLTNRVTVTVNSLPSTSAAGADLNVCGLSTALNANAPVTGTGTWSKVSGPGTVNFSNPNSPSATATVSISGTYLFRWTIVNGLCAPSTDDVQVAYVDNVVVNTNPSSQNLCEGSNIVLTVNASGGGLTYEWFRNGSSIGPASATASTLTIANATAANSGSYSVLVRGTCSPGGISSLAATVDVYETPEVTTHPTNQTVCEGGNAIFTVNAGSTSAPTYQWEVSTNGGASYANVGGATSATLNLASIPLSSNGYLYRARVNGACNVPVNSNVATLTVQESPAIVTSPTPQMVCEGEDVTLSVAAQGTGLMYQWRLDGADIGVPTASPTLSLNDVTTAEAGTYSVRVTGTCNATGILSGNALVTVNRIPDATAPSKNICSGEATDVLITNPNAVPSTGYTWTVQSSTNVAGMSAGSGNYINQTLSTVSPATVGTVIYTIVPQALNCTGASYSVTVNVQTVPDAVASPQAICSGGASNVAISNPNGVPGTSFNWVVLSSTNVTGATAGSGNSINQILTATDGVSAGTVTYRITPSANGCAGAIEDVTVTVNPSTQITNTATQLQSDICSGATLNFTPTSTIGGTTFSWTAVASAEITSGVTAVGNGTITDAPHTSNVTGTVTYIITPSFGGCNGTAVNYVVTVRPLPTASASDAAICSGTAPNISITNPNAVSGTTFTWVVLSSTNVTGATAGSGNTINHILTATDGVSAGTVTYRITPTANGCTGATEDVTVSVNPAPQITNTATQLQNDICSGVALNFTPTTSIGGTTFSWTSTASAEITSGVTASGSGAITDVPLNTTNAIGTVTYTITPSFGGCNGPAVNYVVTVRPLPTASASDAAICSGTASNINITNPNAVSGTTFTWVVLSSTNVSGATAGSGNTINQILTATDGVSAGTVTYRITPTANGCTGATEDVTVTVNPSTQITNTATQLQNDICSGAALNFIPTSTIAGTTFAWTSTASAEITSGVTAAGSGAITDVPLNTTNAIGTVTYTITPSFSGCNGAAVNYVVTVRPLPTASASDAAICSGNAPNITITNPNAVTGTTFTWVVLSSTNVTGATAGSGNTINQILTATDGVSAGTATYRITPSANACTGATEDVTVSVNPSSQITNTATQLQNDICSGVALNFTPTTSIGGTTFSWTAVASAEITSGVAASGTGAITDAPLNTTNTIGTVTYTITPSFAGCNGTAVNYVVTVRPLPTASASDAAICSGTAPNINITNPNAVSGTTFTWVVLSSTNVSGATAGSGNTINHILTATDGVSAGTVTYRITPSANGCVGTTEDVIVAVTPSSQITNPATQLQNDICSGVALNFTPTSTIAGTTFAWTSTASVEITSGVTASGIGAITDAPVNTSNVIGTVTYTITPSFGGCNGMAVNYVVTVRPLPTASASDAAICSGNPPNITITNPNAVTGTTFTWVVLSSTNVSGATAGSGNTINQILTATDGVSAGTVTYRITPTANGCTGATEDVTVTVNPSTQITNTATQLQNDICSGGALNFAPTTSIGGTTFSWTSTASAEITSGVTASGNGAITDAPLNTSNVIGTVTYTITPSFGGCNGTPVNYVVTVRPLPTASASDAAICSGNPPNITITNPNAVSGTTFTWVVLSSTNVTGATAGSGNSINQILTATDGVSAGTVTYRITPTANGCAGAIEDVTVSVNPSTQITNTATQLQNDICSGVALNFTPTTSVGGTTFSWTAVASAEITSGVTASGSGAITDAPLNTTNAIGTVTYTVTPSFSGCNGAAVNYVVTVRPLPTASASDAAICSGTAPNITITNPNAVTGTTFTWVVLTSSNVSGASAGSGSIINQALSSTDGVSAGTVTYRITPTANGCTGATEDVTVSVNPSSQITNTATQLQNDICSGAALNFTPTSTIGGTTFSWTAVASAEITSGVTASGTGAITDAPLNTTNSIGTVTYTITPSFGGCNGAAVNYVVTVRPLPSASASDAAICSGTAPNINITNPNVVSGTTFTWVVLSSTNVSGATAGSGNSINQILTATDGVSAGTVTYRITPTANGCTGATEDVTVSVNPATQITNTATQLQNDICSGAALNFTPTSTIGGTTFSWTAVASAEITSGVTAAGIGAITDAPLNTTNAIGTVTYIITPSFGGCNGPAVNYVVTVRPLPTASASDAAICSGTAPNISITNPNAVSGTTFTWVVLSSTNVSGATAGSGNTINQILTATDGVSAGTATYRITPSANACTGATEDVTVSVNPSSQITNTATQLQNDICSGAALNFTPTSTIAGTTFAWTAVASAEITSGVTAAGNGTITDAPLNTSNVTGTVTYIITPSFGGCNGTAVNYVVTVRPLPTASASDAAICSGNPPNITITNPNAVSGTTFTWVVLSSSNVSGASAGSGNTINQILTATDGVSAGTATYRITPSANACTGATEDVTVSVNPSSQITNTATQLQNDICSGATLNFTPTSTIAGTTFAWTAVASAEITSGVTAAGNGTITDAPLNTSNVTGTVTYTITPSFGGCNGTAVNYVVTVRPLPTASASDAATCSGTAPNITITNPNAVAGTTFTWVVLSSSNVSGASAGSGNTINQILTATDGVSAGTVTYRITPTANGCTGATEDVTVSVNPAPQITNTATQLQNDICSGVALNFTPTTSIGGTTFSWTAVASAEITSGVTAVGNGTITDAPLNTSNVTGTVTYIITPSFGGCNGTAVNYVVTVRPLPTASASDAAICSGTAPNINITNPNAVAGTTYTWIVLSSSNVSGASAGSGSIINQTLSSTDGVSAGTVTYRITPTANGCVGTTEDVTVAINPSSQITNTATQLQNDICSGAALNFIPTSTIAGTTFSWTAVASAEITSGVTAVGNGAITDAPLNTTNAIGTVTYTITPSFGGCNGPAVNYVVTVRPLPTASASDAAICSGTAPNITITNPNAVAGTTFTWVVLTSSNVSGASAGSGNTINHILTATDGVSAGTVTYRITPTANGCVGTTEDVTVAVNPSSQITNPATQLQNDICSGAALNFTPTTSIGGTTFSWTAVASAEITSGVTAGGNGAITDAPLNTTNAIGTVTYTITPSFAGCNGIAVKYVVTVRPLPTASASDAAICSGTASNITITNPNAVSGTTFTWVVLSSTNLSGATAGSGNTINHILTATDGVGTGTVTYRITPSANGCAGAIEDVTVSVNPSTQITNTATQLQNDICSGVALNFTPTTSIGGTTFAWTAVASAEITSGVTAVGNGAITDAPLNTTNAIGTVTYTITPSFAGCNGTAVNYVVTVRPLPTASASDASICSGTAPNINITNPNAVAGTTFTWVVLSSSNVSGASAGSGNTINQILTATDGVSAGTVTYRITPTANGCTGATEDVTVSVNPSTQITNTATQLQNDICSGAALNFTPTSTIAGTTFSWTAVTSAEITSGVTASGSGAITDAPLNTSNVTGTVTYTITPSFGGCNGTAVNYVVTVRPLPTASASDAATCSGTAPNITITNPNAVAGTTFTWVVLSSSNVSGASAGSGNTINQILTATDGVSAGTVTYRITPTANGCVGTTEDVTVTVNPSTQITNTATQLQNDICSGAALNFTPTSTIAGTTFAWTSTASAEITSGVTAAGNGAITDAPLNTTNAIGTVTYTITPSFGGCNGTAVNYVVTVRPLPTASASDAAICSGTAPNITITNPNAVSGTTFTWVVLSSTNVSGATAGSGNTINQILTATDGVSAGTVTYRITPTANGCTGATEDVTVTVNPSTQIINTATQLQSDICSGVALNFTPTTSIGGTTFSWTAVASAEITSGVTAVGNGTITDVPLNTSNVTGTVTYTITPSFGGCNGMAVNYVVTVRPLPTASVADATICSGETASLTILPAPQNVAGTTFQWTATSSANILGAANGNGSAINQLLQTTDASIGTVSYSITPVANSCSGPVHIVTITVNPIATVTAGIDFAVCEPVSFPLNGLLGGAATSGTWTVVSASSGMLSSSTTNGVDVEATYTIAPADIDSEITFRLTTNDPDLAGPCSSVSDDVRVRINRRAIVTLPSDYVICEPQSIDLTGTLSGGASSAIWSSSASGVLSTTSIIGPGPTFSAAARYTTDPADVSNTLTFRLTTNDPDGSGPCTQEFAQVNIQINESAKVDAGAAAQFCDYDTVVLTGAVSGSASSAFWTKPAAATGTLQNANALTTEFYHTKSDLTLKNLTFILTTNDPDGAGPCTASSDQVTMTINKLDAVDLVNLEATYAENDAVQTLIAFPNDPDLGTGVFTGPGIVAGTNQFNPGNANAGTSNIITYTWQNTLTGCVNADSDTTIVNALTDIEFTIVGATESDPNEIRVCSNSGNLWIKGSPGIHDNVVDEANTRFESDEIPGRILQLFNTTTGATEYYLNTDGLDPNGFYTVRYKFMSKLGVPQALVKRVLISASPVADITMTPACLLDEVTFLQNSGFAPGLNPEGDVITRYTWDFDENGEGAVVNAPITTNPRYRYTITGEHFVSLTVETENQCRHTVTEVVRVGVKPILDFTWSKICSGRDTTEFVNLSLNDGFSSITQYQWDFGDNSVVLSPGAPADPFVDGGTFENPHHRFMTNQVYGVKLSATTNDGCTADTTKQVYILSYETPPPITGYFKDFEVNDASWVALPLSDVDTVNSWTWGPVGSSTISPAANGPAGWWTGKNNPAWGNHATYFANERSEVVGPCLNLSTLERPMISFDYWSDNQEGFDGLVLQYSIDGAQTWESLGDASGAGINWYNESFLASMPGGQDNYAWSGSTGGWKTARFNLEEIEGSRELVVFRFAFASNNDNPKTGPTLEGFAFDNVYVGNKKKSVLVEHFTSVNAAPTARDYFTDLYNAQFEGRNESDFNVIQYHLPNEGPDQINENNPLDPFARAQWYGVSFTSTALMDGIYGPYHSTNFDGTYSQIDSVELDRRALEDPLFIITPTIDPEVDGPLTGTIEFEYTGVDPDNTPKILQAVLVEDGVALNGNNMNVVRKLLQGPEGSITDVTWTTGTKVSIDIDFSMRTEVADPQNLSIVIFVQDKLTRRILNSVIVKAPAKEGDPITGVEDQAASQLKDLQVYPIPASARVNVRLNKVLPRNYDYQIVDQRGVELTKGTLQRDLRDAQGIDISRIPNGIYFLRIQTGDKAIYYRKIAVMNRD